MNSLEKRGDASFKVMILGEGGGIFIGGGVDPSRHHTPFKKGEGSHTKVLGLARSSFSVTCDGTS